MTLSAGRLAVWAVAAAAAFALLAAAIMTRPAKHLNDFDQSFYLTIAHDLARHGVFSNGIFDRTDSTVTAPEPGMFFVPIYPALVYAMMQVDSRFRRAVECHTLANHKRAGPQPCEIYARPVHLLHAGLLAAAVIAIAATSLVIFGQPLAAALAGLLAVAAFAVEADLFSFIMTESTGIALFSLATFAFVLALKTGRPGIAAGSGLLLGLLILARPSFMVLAPVWTLVIVFSVRRIAARPTLAPTLLFVVGVAVALGPWIARNAAVIGKAKLSEEYGSVAMIERFAYNTMTAREFALAFPYCIPKAGPAVVNAAFGLDAMSRFEWDRKGSFFETGRAARERLVAAHHRIDPVFGDILKAELSERGLHYVLTTIPLSWCGLWVAQLWSVPLLPLFVVAGIMAWRRGRPLFLLYAVPPLLMVGVHAAASNHYPRYNLMLIGPIAVGAAWVIVSFLPGLRRKVNPQPT